jgi:hypothetical protein
MGESPSGDLQDLWGQYQATKALVDTVQAQIALVQSALDGGPLTVKPGSADDDYLSFSRSGTDGSENYNRQSLLQRQDELISQLERLFETMKSQRRLAIMARSGWGGRRVGRGGTFWRGW